MPDVHVWNHILIQSWLGLGVKVKMEYAHLSLGSLEEFPNRFPSFQPCPPKSFSTQSLMILFKYESAHTTPLLLCCLTSLPTPAPTLSRFQPDSLVLKRARPAPASGPLAQAVTFAWKTAPSKSTCCSPSPESPPHSGSSGHSI